MEFRVLFYETEEGNKPLVDFLELLRGRQPTLHRLVIAGLRKLRQRQHHGPPLTTPIEGVDGLFELRVGGTNIARVFFFFRPGQEIVCTHGYVKKSQRLDSVEVARAARYRAEWEARPR